MHSIWLTLFTRNISVPNSWINRLNVPQKTSLYYNHEVLELLKAIPTPQIDRFVLELWITWSMCFMVLWICDIQALIIYYATDSVVVIVLPPLDIDQWDGKLGPPRTMLKWFMIHKHGCNGPERHRFKLVYVKYKWLWHLSDKCHSNNSEIWVIKKLSLSNWTCLFVDSCLKRGTAEEHPQLPRLSYFLVTHTCTARWVYFIFMMQC